jgi:tetratricopeptide (TPR) repeat protein
VRPNADETLKSLAGTETADAGDLAKKGWDAYQRGDVEKAAESFTTAAAQPDVRPWVLYALGLSQVALARPLDGVASWERVRTAVPDFEPVYIDLADAYVQLSDLTRALAVLRDAEKRWPKDAEIHNAIGVIHFRRGALDDAIESFARATVVEPDEALGYWPRARVEMRFARGQRYVSSQRKWVAPEDDRRKAEESYERCVKLGGPCAGRSRRDQQVAMVEEVGCECKVQVQGAGCRVQGAGCKVQGAGAGAGCKVQVQGARCRWPRAKRDQPLADVKKAVKRSLTGIDQPGTGGSASANMPTP